MTELCWPIRRTYRAPALRVREHQFAWGSQTFVMGIINVTPDSFSGDGTGGDITATLALARSFEAAGAHILDIGGESTRPNARPLDPSEEMTRVIPAVLVGGMG